MNNFKVGDLVVIVNKYNYKDSLRLLSKYSDKKYNYVLYLDDKEFCKIYFKEHLPTIMDSFISQNIPFRVEVKRKCKCNTK